MNTLITGFTILLTVLVAMALGVYMGYGLITGLLNALGNRQEVPAPATAVLVTSDAHFGD